MRTLQERRAKYMSTAPIYEALLISARQACAVANQNGRRTGPAAVQLLLVALSPVRDLLFCAKHLSFAASRVRSAMGGKGQGWGECCQNCSGMPTTADGHQRYTTRFSAAASAAASSWRSRTAPCRQSKTTFRRKYKLPFLRP